MNKTLHSLLAVSVAAIALTHGGISNATVVEYGFSATITSMFEHDGASGVNTYVNSSTFPGSIISNGGLITGIFEYDTAAPLSPYYQPDVQTSGTYQLYTQSGANQRIHFTVAQSGLTYTSSTLPYLNTTIQVANNASTFSGWDIFAIGNSAGYNPFRYTQVPNS